MNESSKGGGVVYDDEKATWWEKKYAYDTVGEGGRLLCGEKEEIDLASFGVQ